MRHLFAGVVVSVMLCAAAPPARAQTAVERFERQLEQIRRETVERPAAEIPAGRRVLLDYGGYFLPNYLSLDDQQGENHVLRQYDLVGYARLNIEGGHEIFARGRLSYLDFNPRDSFDGEGDDFEPTLERAYYRYDPGRAGLDAALGPADNVFFQGGRQLAYWGNGLVLSQTLDGVIFGASLGPADVQFLGGLTPKRTVDFDATRPDFDDDTHRGFYGAMLSAREGQHRPYAYFLRQDDQNHDQALSAGPTVTRFGYDSYYVGVGQAGSFGDRLLYGVELVYEGGRGLSNSFTLDGGSLTPVDQSNEDIQAYAADVRLDYLLNDPYRSRLSAELIYASGDDDRLTTNNTLGGNQPGTRDEAFNAFGLLNTGLAFTPSVSNLYVLRLGAATVPFPEYRPLRNLQVGVDAFLFRKADGDAPIDEPTTDTAYLGWEPDVFLNWQIRSDVTLALRYGIFFPNSDAVVDDSARQFIFAGLTFAF